MSQVTTDIRSNAVKLLPVILALALALPALGQTPVTFSKSFTPGTIGPGSSSKLQFTINNVGAVNATSLAFSDTLPAAVTIATPSSAFTTCSGATVSAPDGGGTITFSGGQLAASSSCTVTVNVTASAVGTHVNTSGDLTSSLGNHGPASANLVVATDRPGFTKSFSPSSLPISQISTLTFTIDNTANTSGLAFISFTDTLPAGIEIAPLPNKSTTCGDPLLPPTFTAAAGTSTISFSANGLLPSNPSVAAGASCTVQVDVKATAIGAHQNVSSELTNSGVSAGFATDLLTVTASDLILEKVFSPNPVPPGDTTTLTFTLTNPDRFDSATGVTFSDNLNAALTGMTAIVLPSTPCGAGSSISGTSTLTFSNGTIPSGGSCTFDVGIQVPAAATPGTYTNTTSAPSGTVGGVPKTGNAATADIIVQPIPRLTKAFLTDPVAPGDTVDVSFTVTNTSSSQAASNISFTDTLASFIPGITVTTLPPNGFCGGSSTLTAVFDGNAPGNFILTLSGASLAAGGSCTFQATLTIPTDASSNVYTNTTSEITADVGGTTLTGSPATDTLQVIAGPRLSKQFNPGTVVPGGTTDLEFTITHEPTASAGATGISFTDDLGAALTGLTATVLPAAGFCGPSSTISGTSTLTVSGAEVAVGGSCTFMVTVQVPTTAVAGVYTNTTSSVTASVGGFATTSTPSTAQLTVAGLVLTKSFTNDPIGQAGGNVNLQFTITNNSATLGATGISFTDDIDANLAGLNGTLISTAAFCGPSSTATELGGELMSFANMEVAAASSCTFNMTVAVPAGVTPAFYPNTTSSVNATINSTPVTLPGATDTLEVTDPLTFSKVFAPDLVAPGDTTTLTFTIANSDTTQTITAASFTDDLDAVISGLSATSFSSAGCGTSASITGASVITASALEIFPSSTCTITANVQVPLSAPLGSVGTNTTSTLNGSLGGITAVSAPPATDDLSITPRQFDLVLTKTESIDPVIAGSGAGNLTYTVTITNNGPSDAVGVTVNEALTVPAGVGSVVFAPSGSTTFSGATWTIGALANGASETLTVTLTVDPTAAAGTDVISNTATINSGFTGTDTNLGNNTATVLTSIARQVDISLATTESIDPVVAGSGVGNLTYVVTATNNGPSDASGLTISDVLTLPAGVSVVSTTPSGTTTFAGSTWTIGTLATGASETLTIVLTAGSATLPGVDVIGSTATVATLNEPDTNAANDTSTVLTSVIRQVDVALGTTESVDPVFAGSGAGNLTYVITATNSGPSDASGLTISDVLTLPAGVSVVSTTPSGATSFAGTTWTIGTLAAGASETLTIVLTAGSSTLPGVDVIGSAATVATLNEPDSNAANDTSTVLTSVSTEAELAISKTGAPDPVVAGGGAGNLTYTVTVLNNGPSDALGVTVTDVLPPNTTLDSTTGCSEDPSGVPTCSLGTLAPGASTSFTIVVTVGAAATGTLTNTVTVTSSTPDSITTNNTASVVTTVGVEADLSITKTGPANANFGSSVSYTITVSNAGPSSAQSVIVNDPTPAGLRFNSNSGACTTTFPCNLGTLAPGATATVNASYTVVDVATDIVNTASVTSTSPDSNAANNTATVTTKACLVPIAPIQPADGATGVATTGKLQWTRGFADSYQVFFGPAGQGCTTNVGSTTSLEFAYADLEIGTDYEWRIVSQKAGCPQLASSCFRFRTSGCSTVAPVPLTPANNAVDVVPPVTFTWTAVPEAKEYKVWRVGDSEPLGTTTGTTFTASLPEGEIQWFVEAIFASCPSTRSAIQSFTVTLALECSEEAPQPIEPVDGASELTSPVTFSWTPVSLASGYAVWVSVEGDFPVIVGTTSGETTVTAPVPSGDLEWFVQVLFEECPPNISEPRTLNVTPKDNCPTEIPEAISPENGAEMLSPIVFEWTDVPEAIDYALWISIDGDTPAIYSTTPDLSIEQELPAGEIQWFVEAIFDGCPTRRSVPRSLTVLEPPPCQNEGPGLVAPFDGAEDLEGLIEFAWDEVEDATAYRVWASIDDGQFELIGTSLVDTSLKAAIEGTRVVWYVQALFNGCPETESERREFTVAPADNCEENARPQLSAPPDDSTRNQTEITFAWSSVTDAVGYELWTIHNGGEPSLVARLEQNETSARIRVPLGEIEWFVRAIFSGCPFTESIHRTVLVQLPPACDLRRPLLISPPNGAAGLTSPTQFVWTEVEGASSYQIFVAVNGGAFSPLGEQTTKNTALVAVSTGLIEWFVDANHPTCPTVRSTTSRFRVEAKQACTLPKRPLARVIGKVSTSEPYAVQWLPVAGATIYEVQESPTENFVGRPVRVVRGTFTEFVHDEPGLFYYRVRALSDCAQERGPYSKTISIIVDPDDSNTEAGDVGEVKTTIFLCLDPAGNIIVCDPGAASKGISPREGVQVTLETTQDFQTVDPPTAMISGDPTPVTITSDTSNLPPGSSTGSLIVTPSSGSKSASNGATTISTGVSLATPISPVPRNEPQPNSLIVPVVAHAEGINSTWRSDIRLTNVTSQVVEYQLYFTPSSTLGSSQGKQTTVNVEPGLTVAIDDILVNWFGEAAANSSGVLEIRPLNIEPTNQGSIASSRTFNVSEAGTFGQFVPALKFNQFIGGSGSEGPSTLSIQQISQSSRFRTNFGFVEGSGKGVGLLVTIFDASGSQVGQIPVSLAGGEQKQLNGFLAEQGISLEEGRAEISVVSGGGKVMGYASVVDNATSDPQLIPAVTPSNFSDTKYIVSGVADLDLGFARWRTDVRIFNESEEPVEAQLVYYPQEDLSSPTEITLTIGPRETRVLDDVLASTFGVINSGGAIQIQTAEPKSLVVTGRTYTQSEQGTIGQFIPGVPQSRAVKTGGRALHIVQVESSHRFRTNLGLTEVSGSPATVEISAVIPGSITAPKVVLNLQGNQFIQLPSVLRSLGLSEVYNGRISVRVVGGSGSVTAYGSMIDNLTQDPTYIPAQ